MATSKPDFPEAQAFAQGSFEEPTHQRGCFFYGCLFSGALALLLLICVGIFSYFAYRSLVRLVEENTATAPRELPKVELPPAARQTLDKRIESFKKAVDTGSGIETLVLTADEVNARIEENPDWKGQVYVTIDGDKLRGKLSLSLEKLSAMFEKLGIGMLRGRYFNGEVELKAALRDGILNVAIESLEVNGRQLPGEMVEGLKNATIKLSEDPKANEAIRKIDSLEIKDGKIIIKRRVVKPGPERAASPIPNELPDDVLAPADPRHPEGTPAKVAAPPGTTGPTPPARP